MRARSIFLMLAGFLAITTISGVAAATRGRPSLSEGLRQVADLVDATVTEVAAGRRVDPLPDNARLEQARQLRNNHSVRDHSDSLHAPGYNDCDAWWNVLIDGWSGHYGLELVVRDEQDGARLLQEVERYWERLGYDVQTYEYGGASSTLWGARVWTESDAARFQFTVDWKRGVAILEGTTSCLPPG